MRRRKRGILRIALPWMLAACSTSHTTHLDAGRSVDAAPMRADARSSHDAGAAETGADGAPPAFDAGRTSRDGIVCGDAICEIEATACRASCLSLDVAGGPAPTCVFAGPGPAREAAGECPGDAEASPYVIARCDGPEDCDAGAICLAASDELGYYPSCGCDVDGPDMGCAQRWSRVLCHSVDDCPTWATACMPDPSLQGFYSTCRSGA